MRILGKFEPLALLWLRTGLGVIFFFHGYQKLFGAPASSIQAFQRLGFPPYAVYLSGTLELFGAILLALGLFTRVTALLLGIEMAVVLVKVALPHGHIYALPGYELILALCCGSLALTTVGAGRLSIDAVTFEAGGKGRSKARG